MDIVMYLLAGFGVLAFVFIGLAYAFAKITRLAGWIFIKKSCFRYQHKDGKTKYYKVIETDFDTYTKLVSDYENKFSNRKEK
ncbi:hypothetical protein BHC49_01805 [Snodgrassella alvi]|uniref:Uncharacterized protein n=2 Tax=Snodgrassella alvi TaxID=1196083 RepID=A0A2N9Y0R9_9NEIS|nr:hypothetical protein BHC49_01805 [Snodgrassella alvi]